MDLSELILLIAINALAFFWQPKEGDEVSQGTKIVIYIISAIISMVIGIGWMSNYFLISTLIVGIGTYQLLLAVIETIRMGGSSRGLSQFKGIFNAIRNKRN